MNTAYVYQGSQVGEFRNSLLWAAGPASYTPMTAAGTGGDVVYNPGANEYINFPCDCTSKSGNYKVRFVPTDVGNNIIRAGSTSPSQSGWTAVWEYAGSSVSPQIGVPLTLGTLSAAATNSTFTTNGVATVLTTTPPPLGSFVLLTNGASGKGIFLNGTIVYVNAVTAGVSYGFNFAAAKSLNYASAVGHLEVAAGIRWKLIESGFSWHGNGAGDCCYRRSCIIRRNHHHRRKYGHHDQAWYVLFASRVGGWRGSSRINRSDPSRSICHDFDG